VLLLPVVLYCKAPAPTAMLEPPIVLHFKALAPTATFKVPEVFLIDA
jgi:hypothetical protein